jgi:hypothetical protein
VVEVPAQTYVCTQHTVGMRATEFVVAVLLIAAVVPAASFSPSHTARYNSRWVQRAGKDEQITDLNLEQMFEVLLLRMACCLPLYTDVGSQTYVLRARVGVRSSR